MTHEDEHERLVRRLADLDAAEEGTLDPNDVARLAAGRPGRDVRDAIHERMHGEDAGVAAAVAAEAARRAPAARHAVWRWAAAAAVLLAVGAWWTTRGEEPRALGDRDLEVAFHALHEAEPDVFAGIEPVLAPEREEGGVIVNRGGIEVLAPRGALLDGPPSLRWTAIDGADTYAVSVLSDEGDVVFEATATDGSVSLETPLGPGDYVVRVRASVAGIDALGTRAFRIASPEERARYESALQMIDAHVDPALRPVARAHVALRLDLFAEAQGHLDAATHTPAAALAAETRAYLERLQGR